MIYLLFFQFIVQRAAWVILVNFKSDHLFYLHKFFKLLISRRAMDHTGGDFPHITRAMDHTGGDDFPIWGICESRLIWPWGSPARPWWRAAMCTRCCKACQIKTKCPGLKTLRGAATVLGTVCRLCSVYLLFPHYLVNDHNPISTLLFSNHNKHLPFHFTVIPECCKTRASASLFPWKHPHVSQWIILSDSVPPQRPPSPRALYTSGTLRIQLSSFLTFPWTPFSPYHGVDSLPL